MAIHNHGRNQFTQGQGTFTVDKQYGLDRVLSQWFSIAGKVVAKHSKWAGPSLHYVDMNAGSGYNHVVKCNGSPLIVINLALDKLRYNNLSKDTIIDAWFIEKNHETFDELCERIDGFSISEHPLGKKVRYRCCQGDSVDIVFDKILPTLPDKQYGLIYFDPNGIKMNRDISVFDAAKRVCDDPKMRFTDVLIRFSGTNYKRVRRVHSKYPSLKEQLAGINKNQWICRRLYRNELGQRDPFQWTFLFGTNWTDYRAWESEGFYKIEDQLSEFDIINSTQEELTDA